MYQVFATSDSTGMQHIGILAGDQASYFQQWTQNMPNIPDSISIPDVPIISFLSNHPNDFQVASWISGSVHADKYSWGRGKLPPQPTFSYRMFKLGVTAGQEFRCVGFSATGIPQLELTNCGGDSSHMILMQAQVVQISDVLQRKRKFELNCPQMSATCLTTIRRIREMMTARQHSESA